MEESPATPTLPVYQQTRRWLAAGVFEAIVHDLRCLLREIEERTGVARRHPGQSDAAVETGDRRGGKVHQAGTPWAARFRRLARDHERLPETLAGLQFLAFAVLMLARIATLRAENAQRALGERSAAWSAL